MVLRDYDREGYAEGGDEYSRVGNAIRGIIKQDLETTSFGRMPQKWLRKIQITDKSDAVKVKKIGGLMSALVKNSSRCRVIRDVARGIVRGHRVEPKDHENELWALQHWIQNNIRYVFDTGEQFQTPQRQLLDWYHGHDGADCDCLTMLYLALARALGHNKLAIGLLDSRGDGTLSHAIALVKLPRPKAPWNWKWIAIELTKRKTFGWMTPKATKVIAIPISGSGVK